MASCETLDTLTELQEELIDRFGKLPEAVRALVDTHRLRILAKPLGIIKIDAHSESVLFQFMPKPPIDPLQIITLIQKNKNIKLSGPDKLRMTFTPPQAAARVMSIRTILGALAS